MQHLGLLKPRLGFWNIDLNAVCTLRSRVLPERGCPLSSHEASSSFLALSVRQIQRPLSGDGEFSFRGLLWYRRRNLSLFLGCRGGKKKWSTEGREPKQGTVWASFRDFPWKLQVPPGESSMTTEVVPSMVATDQGQLRSCTHWQKTRDKMCIAIQVLTLMCLCAMMRPGMVSISSFWYHHGFLVCIALQVGAFSPLFATIKNVLLSLFQI